MRLRDVSYALKAVAEVAQAGEQLVGSLDRSRSRSPVGSTLLAIGVGVGIGALLFSESARRNIRQWLIGKPVAPEPAAAPAADPATVVSPMESRVDAAGETDGEASPVPH